MGKALYRKYRSKTLDDVVGQDHITSTLKNALSTGAISHAYLFTGPRGVGKTSVARILAHEINEITYQEEATHLDIIEIDAASNRRIDEIRDLRDKVHIAPTSSKYKVYIIDEVHMLTREAFNALLKTLEEPPEHAVFILATTEAHKVPDTIISRTQRFSFKPIENTNAVAHLRSIADSENIKITDAALELLANHAKGSFRDSISMLDQISGVSEAEIDHTLVAEMLGIPNSEVLEQVVKALANNNTEGLFQATQELKSQGASASNTATSLIDTFRKHVLRNTKDVNKHRYVAAMKALLPLTGSQSSFEAIEVGILDAFDFGSSQLLATTSNETPKETPELEKTEQTTKEQEPKIAVIEEVKVVASTDEPSEQWMSILQALKGSHNTLYGVLRMAKADINEDVITLTFAFDFHKKQVVQNKNLDILQTVTTKTLGKKHTIKLEVKKNKKPDTKQQKPKQDTVDDTLKNVSNIFGDAELLES